MNHFKSEFQKQLIQYFLDVLEDNRIFEGIPYEESIRSITDTITYLKKLTSDELENEIKKLFPE